MEVLDTIARLILLNIYFNVLGSGGYSDSSIGGVSTTGNGEAFMKTCVALRIVLEMERGNLRHSHCIHFVTERWHSTARHGNLFRIYTTTISTF